MNYPELKLRLLTTLLKDHSSAELSRRLGYEFNQVGRWLSGTKQCRWSEFWDLCEVVQTPLPPVLRSVFAHDPLAIDDPADFLSHLRGLYPNDSIESLGEKIHCHPSTLKRYLRGDTSCDLDVVLALMDLSEQLLARFFERLLGPDKFRHFSELEQELKLPATLAVLPVAGALEASLRLDEYRRLERHSDALIADKIGVTADEVRSLIPQLLAKGSIVADGEKFKPAYDTVQFEGIDAKSAAYFVRFWSYRSFLRLAASDQKPVTKGSIANIVGFRIAALSTEASKRISDILFKCHQEMISVMESDDKPKSDVRVILAHHFSAQDVPQEFLKSPRSTNLNRLDQIHTLP